MSVHEEKGEVAAPAKGAGIFFFAAGGVSRLLLNRERAQSLRAARLYEKRADRKAEAEFAERGKLRLAAGQSYLNGGEPGTALIALELAQSDLEVYCSQRGTWDAYTSLAHTYRALEAVYQKTDRIGDSEAIRGRAVSLAEEVGERYFGLRTGFLSSGETLIGNLNSALPTHDVPGPYGAAPDAL